MQQLSKDLPNRPLGIGELADRSVTILLKNPAPFALVWLACTVPGMLLSAWGASSGAAFGVGVGALLTVLGSNVGVLATAALVGKIYAGEELQWGWALGRGASKIISAIGLGILLGLIAIIPVVGLWLVTAGIFASLVSSNPAIAVIAAAIPALALLIAGAIFYLLEYVALSAIVIEGRSANQALTKAFGYVFREGRFWPNVGLGICLALVVFGGSLVNGMIVAFLALKVNFAFVQSVSAILTAVVNAVGATVAVVFYFDMRMRYDGYDLEQSLDALEQPATA